MLQKIIAPIYATENNCAYIRYGKNMCLYTLQKVIAPVYTAEKNLRLFASAAEKSCICTRCKNQLRSYTLQKNIVHIYAAESNCACVNVISAPYTGAIIFCSVYGRNFFSAYANATSFCSRCKRKFFLLRCIQTQLFSAVYTDAYFFIVYLTNSKVAN